MQDPDATYKEYIESLRPKLTDDFLMTLVEAVKICGNTVDIVEAQAFVTWCFCQADKETPNLEAYDI